MTWDSELKQTPFSPELESGCFIKLVQRWVLRCDEPDHVVLNFELCGVGDVGTFGILG